MKARVITAYDKEHVKQVDLVFVGQLLFDYAYCFRKYPDIKLGVHAFTGPSRKAQHELVEAAIEKLLSCGYTIEEMN